MNEPTTLYPAPLPNGPTTAPLPPIIMSGPQYTLPRTPYRCPVCNGHGIVPAGFYETTEGCWTTTSTAPEPCRACNGTGIVWG